MTATAASSMPAKAGIGFKQFVTLIAAIMAVNALAIDSMLPALPAIGHSLGVEDENRRQWIVTAYLLGFGAAQIVYGPLADRLGRKPVLLAGLASYAAFALLASLSTSFATLLAARVLMGVGAAATRVLAVSIVRDRFSGREMARVMSLAFIVFLAVPILAPSIGQIIMLFGPWRWVFGALCCFGAAVFAWSAVRLPETLHPSARLPFSPGRVAEAFRLALTDRTAVGYMLASTLVLGALFGFINSAQQIFADTLHAPALFTSVFALIAGFMALSSFLNSRIIGRFGPRRVSHAALCGFIALSAVHVAVALTGRETLVSFAALQAGVWFCFGLVFSNFGSLAMEPLGRVAGTASSVQGCVTTFGGALIGFLVGQSFDGTAVPMSLGFVCCGALALGIVLVAERGRLFGAGRPALAGEAAGLH
ncbi:multidrug effflux MFS transporter [Lichenibacterium minor]|uniref:multidrug effflux MFS transporter n=1 Tax=Lichenibacterium minor TaxID=2316528 RepID=UPI0013EB92B4|nr:multidrug effflux MFS transporter [Lichenibacterium minor]